MKIKLTKGRKIKGKPRKKGDSVIVKKDLGERLISKGLANRLIGPRQNRFGPRRFHSHTEFKE